MKFKLVANCIFEAENIVEAMSKLSVFFKEMNQEEDKVNKEIAKQLVGEIDIKPI